MGFRLCLTKGNEKTQVAAFIKRLRKARGLSQCQLAELVGVSQSVVGRLEGAASARYLPRIDFVVALAHAMKFDIKFSLVKGRNCK